MKHIFIITLSFCLASVIYGQTQQWKLVHTIEENNIDAWDVDPVGRVLYSKGDRIKKLDTTFTEVFTQSSSSFGKIAIIDAHLSLKTLIFSKNQQQIGFLDKTLTFLEGTIDLLKIDVSYATNACYSNQTKRFWIFDSDNSKLLRFEGYKSSRLKTEITNLYSITGQMNAPTFLSESQNDLLLFYKGVGVYVFDYYGSLIRFYEYPKALDLHYSEDYLFLLNKGTILRINRKTGEEKTIKLPIENALELRVRGDNIFLKNKDGIKEFFLIPQ